MVFDISQTRITSLKDPYQGTVEDIEELRQWYLSDTQTLGPTCSVTISENGHTKTFAKVTTIENDYMVVNLYFDFGPKHEFEF